MKTRSFTPTIGLEIHVELETESKMFCGCANDPHGAEPNTHTCPICLAHPGTLPVPNESAIEKLLLFGEAVGATSATFSEFDRKHYFYPDIPKAYQISQYAFPLLQGGSLVGVELTRVHLEEDTARSQHDRGDASLVDFNRAGVPLMELVTEPVMHDAETVGRFARELQLLLQTLGISGAHMERGEMRVEANVSVSDTEELGTKVEVKNLNSFRSVTLAVAYEIERQVAQLEAGNSIVQETRGWDEVRLRTFSQRKKETAMDYRYFPDPDIPKLELSSHEPFTSSRLAEKIPLLPSEKREKYNHLGLPSEQIEILISTPLIDKLFAVAFTHWEQEPDAAERLKLAGNYLTSDLVAIADEIGETELQLTDMHFMSLIEMLHKGEINSRVAKDLLRESAQKGTDPALVAKQKNLLQITDPTQLTETAKAVVAGHASVVAEYRAGKEASLQFLIGQGMKATRGAADPSALADAIRSEIS